MGHSAAEAAEDSAMAWKKAYLRAKALFLRGLIRPEAEASGYLNSCT
jgi:hypothetical protein